MKHLKLVRKEKLDYIVPMPDRLRSYRLESKIRIIFIKGEYCYLPRCHTFGNGVEFCVEELELIVEELKRLNAGLDQGDKKCLNLW